MRALVVTNMHPSPAAPALGRFVADQVAALRRLPGIEVELFAFPPACAPTRAPRASCAGAVGASASTSSTRITG